MFYLLTSTMGCFLNNYCGNWGPMYWIILFFLSWIGRNDHDIIYGWNWMSIHGIPLIPHVQSFLLFSLLYSMISSGLFFLTNFLVRLCRFPVPTMNNTMKIDSITMLNCKYGLFLNFDYKFFNLAQLWI